MNCSQCNALLPSDAAFCYQCGQRLSVPSKSSGLKAFWIVGSLFGLFFLMAILAAITSKKQTQSIATASTSPTPTATPNIASADYKSAYQEARKLGKEMAQGGAGLPNEVGYEIMVNVRLADGKRKISDPTSWRAGFITGYKQGWIDVNGEELASIIPGVSLSNYLLLKNGMSYREACRILGSSGTELSRSNIAGYETVMYQWKTVGGIANMNAMFQNDKLVTKAQYGLR